MKIAFSNRVERLFEDLKKDLYIPGQSLFSKRQIVVPSPAVKNWLIQKLADHFDVAMGVEVSYLEQTLSSFKETHKEFLSSVALSFAIEEEIRKSHRDKKNSEIWLPLWRYLDSDQSKELSKKGERRIQSLADMLASLFQQYGTYGSQLVQEWETSLSGGWQGQLWRQLYSHTTYPAKEFGKKPRPAEKNTFLYLFSMSYLAPIHHRFLEELAKQVPVHYYLLSPCQEFWSDLLTSKESGRLQMYWKKRGVAEGQQRALEEYLSDCNPLLANYGRVGREMAKTLEESDLSTTENYYFEEESKTLLAAVQTDLCLMQKSLSFAMDDSIQVHRVANSFREVEVVKDILLDLIDKKKIAPEQIIVAAPHIGQYAPYIKCVFEDSPLDYQIMDLSTPLHHEATRCFLKLLELPFGRLEVTSLVDLLESKPFREKRRFSLDDVEQMVDWLGRTGVKWGEDRGHREQILKRDHQSVTLLESSNKGTWDDAIEQLVLGLVSDKGLIESSKAELLGKFIDLLQMVKKDLKILDSGRKMSVAHWCLELKKVAEEYLNLDDQAENILFGVLRKLQRGTDDALFQFSSIKNRLFTLFEKEAGTFRETHLHAVRFCSMLPMRAIPASVIVLMGMQEGVFPKKEKSHSLNQCLLYPDKVDFCPSIADYDRFLFLEAILSARDTLIFTYQGLSGEDGKELPPNPLLKELLQYIPSLPTQAHPRFSFLEEKHFSFHSFQEATSYFKNEKEKKHHFLQGIEKESEKSSSIDIQELALFAKNPLRLYMNESLNLFLRRDSEGLTDVESFELSSLERYFLKKEALLHPLDQLFEIAEQKRFLPQGIFKKLEWKKIEEDIRHLPKSDDVFSITLSEDCFEPIKEKEHWIVPSLKIGNKSITGTFNQVTKEGMFTFQKDLSSDIIKLWPEYLVFHQAVKQFQIPIGTDLLFTKNGKTRSSFFEEAGDLIDHYCNYFNRSKGQISFLLPEWISPLLSGNDKELQKKIEAIFPSYDPYLSWLFRGGNLPSCNLVKEEKELASLLYENLITNWCK